MIKRKYISHAFVCSLLFAALFFTACQKQTISETKSEAVVASEILDLGEKYLLEMDYEQAVVQFLKVIEVDPMNPRGYTGAAEAYIGLGEVERAADVLRQGADVLPNNAEIQEQLAELELLLTPEVVPTPTQESPVVDMIDTPFMRNLYDLFTNGNIEEIKNIMRSGEFKQAAENTTAEIPAIYMPLSVAEVNSGKCVGIYGTHVYYGDYVDNVRSGEGIWIWVNEMNDSVFEGQWANGKPNGNGESISNNNSNEPGAYRSTRKGTVIDGLWDGEAQITHYWLDGRAEPNTYVMKFNVGKVIVWEGYETEQGYYPIGIREDNSVGYSGSEEAVNMTYRVSGF